MTLELMHLSSPVTTSSTNNINLFRKSNSLNHSHSIMSLSSSSFCLRGLEHIASASASASSGLLKPSTRIRRRNALAAVLHEQDRQQYEIATSTTRFFYDDSKIREASRKCTRISEDLAAVMGQFDHKAVSNTDDENLFRNANKKSEKKWNFNITATGCGQQQQVRVHRHQALGTSVI